MRRFILFAGLISLWAFAPGGTVAAHEVVLSGSASAENKERQSEALDQQAALAVSQGAIGKRIGNFTFTAGDGHRVKLTDYRGKPLVISLIYTSCYHICPTTTQNLAKGVRIARNALGPDSFNVLTIGFDTPNDTPTAMKRFSQDQNLNISHWEFLSADIPSIEALKQDLGFISTRAPQGFDHLIQATIIDGQGMIYRQVYGMEFEIPLLVEPLKELTFGAPVMPSLISNLGNRIKLFCTVYDPATGGYRFDYSLFIEMVIGLISIGAVSYFLAREWRRNRRRLAG